MKLLGSWRGVGVLGYLLLLIVGTLEAAACQIAGARARELSAFIFIAVLRVVVHVVLVLLLYDLLHQLLARGELLQVACSCFAHFVSHLTDEAKVSHLASSIWSHVELLVILLLKLLSGLRLL